MKEILKNKHAAMIETENQKIPNGTMEPPTWEFALTQSSQQNKRGGLLAVVSCFVFHSCLGAKVLVGRFIIIQLSLNCLGR